MKKQFNVMLITSIVLLVSVIGVLMLLAILPSDELFKLAESEPIATEEQMTGGSALILTPMLIMIKIGLLVVLFLTPLELLSVSAIMQTIARLIQIGEEKRNKIIAGKVFSIISVIIYVFLYLFFLYYLLVAITTHATSLLIVSAAASVFITAGTAILIISIGKIKNPRKSGSADAPALPDGEDNSAISAGDAE